VPKLKANTETNYFPKLKYLKQPGRKKCGAVSNKDKLMPETADTVI
jgi:hypothetical protein